MRRDAILVHICMFFYDDVGIRSGYKPQRARGCAKSEARNNARVAPIYMLGAWPKWTFSKSPAYFSSIFSSYIANKISSHELFHCKTPSKPHNLFHWIDNKQTKHHPTIFWPSTHLTKGVGSPLPKTLYSYYLLTLSPKASKPGLTDTFSSDASSRS